MNGNTMGGQHHRRGFGSLTLPVTVVTLKNWVNAHAPCLQKTLERRNLWDNEFRGTSHMFLSRCEGSGKGSPSLSGMRASLWESVEAVV